MIRTTMQLLMSTRSARCRTIRPRSAYFNNTGILGLQRMTSLPSLVQDSHTFGKQRPFFPFFKTKLRMNIYYCTATRMLTLVFYYTKTPVDSFSDERDQYPSRLLVHPDKCFRFTVHPRRMAIHPACGGLGTVARLAHYHRSPRRSWLAKWVR